MHIGDGSLTAYYNRREFDNYHGHYGRRGRHGHHHHHGFYSGISYYGHFYGGAYYPYGYASVFDRYFYRYPYSYVSVGFSPLWVIDSYPETVYVESPTTVYVDTSDVVVETIPQTNTTTPVGTGVYADTSSGLVGPSKPIEVAPQERIPVNNTFLADGVEAFRTGDYKEARKLFSYSVLDAPQNGFGELSYALALFAEGQYTAASGAIRRGISLVPDVIDRPIDIVRMYGSQEDLESHIQQLRLHVAADPADSRAWLVLGYVLYSSGDPVGASRALDRAANLDPDNPVSAIMRDAANLVIAPEGEPNKTE